MTPGPRAAALVPLLLCGASCLAPLTAPSAFSEEQYLCEEEREADLDARVEGCRQVRASGEPCHGVISFRGVVDTQPVTVDALLTRLTYFDSPENGVPFRRFTMEGRGPYFTFRLDSGGYSLPPGSSANGVIPERSCVPNQPGAQCTTSEQFNVEGRGGNYLSALVRQVRDVRIDTEEDLRVAYSSDLARGGNLDLCFHLLRSPTP